MKDDEDSTLAAVVDEKARIGGCDFEPKRQEEDISNMQIELLCGFLDSLQILQKPGVQIPTGYEKLMEFKPDLYKDVSCLP